MANANCDHLRLWAGRRGWFSSGSNNRGHLTGAIIAANDEIAVRCKRVSRRHSQCIVGRHRLEGDPDESCDRGDDTNLYESLCVITAQPACCLRYGSVMSDTVKHSAGTPSNLYIARNVRTVDI